MTAAAASVGSTGTYRARRRVSYEGTPRRENPSYLLPERPLRCLTRQPTARDIDRAKTSSNGARDGSEYATYGPTAA